MPSVALCVPVYPKRPHEATADALAASATPLAEAGWRNWTLQVVGCPYISRARSELLHQALTGGADTVVFIDSDMSWRPKDLLKLLRTEGDVVAGTYRLKQDDEVYMGTMLVDADGKLVRRKSDGAIAASGVPAGFLKMTRFGVARFMAAYPQFLYGDPKAPHVDLFQHGARDGIWLGEDIAFCRNWRDCGGEIWVVPDLNLDHHAGDEVYKGNFERHLARQETK